MILRKPVWAEGHSYRTGGDARQHVPGHQPPQLTLPPLRFLWVSTPQWTCWIAINADGIITDAAPILRKRWCGRTARFFHRKHWLRYGTAYRVVQLPTLQEDKREKPGAPWPTAMERQET